MSRVARLVLLAALGSAARSDATVADSILALHTLRTATDSLHVAAVLDSLGVERAAGGTEAAFAEAESLVARGLALRRRAAGPASLLAAASLDHVAGLRFNRGDYDGALAPRQECLAIRAQHLPAGDRLVGETQRDLASNLAALGRYAEARPLLETARTTLERSGARNDPAFINLLTTLGEFRRIENRYDEAESCLVQAIRLARASLPAGDPFIAYPINNLAGVYRDQGRFDEAEPLLRESFEIHAAGEPQDALALADAWLNRAELARLQGRMSEAESLYANALASAEQALGSEDPTLVWFLNQYGVLHRDRGRWKAAERLSRRSLAILEQSGGDDPLLAQVLADLAEVLRMQGRAREAEPYARRAVEMRERIYGSDHPEVALAIIVLARCRAAQRDAATDSMVARCVRILDAAPAYPEACADAHAVRAARHLVRGERSAAVADLETAVAIVESLRPRRGGDDARAGFVVSHARLYEDLVRLQIEAGDVAAAFATVERSRARVFQDQLAAARVDLAADVPAAARAPLESRMQDARLQIESYQNQLAAAAAAVARRDAASGERSAQLARLAAERDRWVVELDRAQDELRRASPQWRALAAQAGHPAAVGDVARDAAPRGGVVLVYALGEAGSWVFAIADTAAVARCWPLIVDAQAASDLGLQKAGPFRGRDATAAIAALDLGASPRLATRRGISGVRAVDAPPGDRAQDVRLHALWRVVVPQPLRAMLLAAPAAVVIPDGALHALPFEALVVDAEPRRDWLDAGPVLRYAASATSLVHMQAAAASPRPEHAGGASIVSLADPRFGTARGALAGRTLPPLPATAGEAAAVRDAFAPMPVVALSGAEATEARLRSVLPQSRYVHLATHGIVDRDRDALLAGLALAPGAAGSATPAAANTTPGAAPGTSHQDDGFLQLFEIYRLQLQSDLVVLSACDTNAGALVAGEGMFALSRGFLAAGAQRVVASLWQVEDEATAALVAALFRRVAAAERDGARPGDNSIAIALRDAKREVRGQSQWRQPFYWSSFVLTGLR